MFGDSLFNEGVINLWSSLKNINLIDKLFLFDSDWNLLTRFC